jgi:hypothetical protein
MADRNDEDILRAILEKGGSKAKEAAAAALAQLPSTPAEPTEIKEVKVKKRRKGLKKVIGRISNTKYYLDAEGKIVDKDNVVLTGKIAEELIKNSPIKNAIVKSGQTKQGVPTRKIEEGIKKSVTMVSQITAEQIKINERLNVTVNKMGTMLQKMSTNQETLIGLFMAQNQEFQDKVIESMTGVKAPSRSGGAKPKISTAAGGSRAARRFDPVLVRARAERIARSGMMRNIAYVGGAGLLGAVGGGLLAAGAGVVAKMFTPTPPPAGSENQPAGGDKPQQPPPVTQSSYTGTNSQILATIRSKESRGNYTVLNYAWPKSTASGAYQFTGPTWRSLAKKYGIGTEFEFAYQAPPEVQDAVADKYVSDILVEAGGDVSKVPLKWYTGNIQGKISASAQALNKGLDPAKYQADWLKKFEAEGGQKGGPTTAAAPSGASSVGQSGPSASAAAGAASASYQRTSIPGPGRSGPSAGAAAATSAGRYQHRPAQEPTQGNSDASNVKMTNQNATRNQPITPYLMGAISAAVRDVYGPGARAEVYSGGQGPYPSTQRTGSTRHDNGMAADVYVYAGGRKIMGDDLGRLAQYWLARKIGGAGIEMRGGGIHLDQHADRHPFWFYNAGETQAAKAMVMAGVRGEMPGGAGTTAIAEAPTGTAAAGQKPQYAALGPRSATQAIREHYEASQSPEIIFMNNVINQNKRIMYQQTSFGQTDRGTNGYNPLEQVAGIALAFGAGRALRIF